MKVYSNSTGPSDSVPTKRTLSSPGRSPDKRMHDVRWHSMRTPATVAALSAILFVIAGVASMEAQADDAVIKPSSAEIRSLEGRVKLPPKASALRTYVRYYYASADSGP